MINFSLQQLKSQNPWWDHSDFISRDYHIETLNKQKIQWRPKALAEFNLKGGNIYTLRGARQIGKTTSLKILIKDLLEKKVDSKDIFYYSCNNIDDYQSLIQLFDVYLDWRSEESRKESLIYIFIDEVTFVENWERAVKHLADLGKLRNVFLLLTGSNAYDLKYGTERLPGRRGDDPDPDKIFYPLSFFEFVELNNPGISGEFTDLDFGAFANYYSFNQKELSRLLNLYLLSGGFVSAVNDLAENKSVSMHRYMDYLGWTLGDLAKLNKRESVARQILTETIRMTTSILGWNTIAKKVAVSHVTVSEYVEILELIFILKTVYQIDLNQGLLQLKKNKKIYFTDPFVFWSFYGWAMGWGDYFKESQTLITDEIFKSKFIESVVFDHLLKREKSFEFGNKIFFLKGRREVDFVYRVEKKDFLPIEVKYRNNAAQKDFSIMKKLGFKKGFVVSKDIVDLKGDFKIIPAELFLLGMDRFLGEGC